MTKTRSRWHGACLSASPKRRHTPRCALDGVFSFVWGHAAEQRDGIWGCAGGGGGMAGDIHIMVSCASLGAHLWSGPCPNPENTPKLWPRHAITKHKLLVRTGSRKRLSHQAQSAAAHHCKATYTKNGEWPNVVQPPPGRKLSCRPSSLK